MSYVVEVLSPKGVIEMEVVDWGSQKSGHGESRAQSRF